MAFVAPRRGDFEEKAGSKERPIKIAVKVDARDGVNALVRFSERTSSRSPGRRPAACS